MDNRLAADLVFRSPVCPCGKPAARGQLQLVSATRQAMDLLTETLRCEVDCSRCGERHAMYKVVPGCER